MRTAELDMAMSVDPSDIEDFLNRAAWAVCSTYHTVLKATPGAAIFGCVMLFDIPFIVGWKNIGDYSNTKLITTLFEKINTVLSGITKLVKKYW